jgi:ABC-type multidrug transport system fused ATPase/permease subunit
MVGKNGSGKTTLMYLLQDYFDDYEGKISINGEDIRSIQPTWFHKHIGVIHQEPYIIYGISLRDNLTLGVSRRIEDSELMDCLDRFHL